MNFRLSSRLEWKQKTKRSTAGFFLEIDIFSKVISVHIGKSTFLESTLAPNQATTYLISHHIISLNINEKEISWISD